MELLRHGSLSLLESGETRNLSSSGVLFASSAPVDPGDPVEYIITLPNSSAATKVRLRCKGKVVRLAADSEVAATLERWEFEREPQPRPV